MHDVLQEAVQHTSTPTTLGARQIVLHSITARLDVAPQQQLQAPLTLQEMTQALEEMPIGKLPSPDGVVLEFYLAFWDLIDQEYTTMIHGSLILGSLPQLATTELGVQNIC